MSPRSSSISHPRCAKEPPCSARIPLPTEEKHEPDAPEPLLSRLLPDRSRLRAHPLARSLLEALPIERGLRPRPPSSFRHSLRGARAARPPDHPPPRHGALPDPRVDPCL